MQPQNSLPHTIQPLQLNKKASHQTQTQHPSRAWILDKALVSHLPLVVLLWSTCWLLTGCGKRSYQQFTLEQSPPALAPCCMVNTHVLTEESTEQTFEQFFAAHQAQDMWHRLCFCRQQAYWGGMHETISNTYRDISYILSKRGPKERALLQHGVQAYIHHINQEIAFKNFLEHNRLGEMWKRLNQARGKNELNLTRMLSNYTPPLQTQVLKDLINFIRTHLPTVVDLDLSSNDLTELPDTFGDLIQLQLLNLSGNQLNKLPHSLGNLINLNDLDLSYNQLTELPDNFGNLTQLQILALFSNKLTSLPHTLGNLINLNQLNLYDNKLTSLPATFGDLINLQQLYLSNNLLTQLPDSFGNLTKLEICYLSNNQLPMLPESFRNLTELRDCTVDKNPLLQPNATLQAPYILVTSTNLKLNPFRREEYVRQHSPNRTFNYNFNREIWQIRQPDKPITYIRSYKYYPVIQFITQLGEETFPQPVPLFLDLSGKELVERVYNEEKKEVKEEEKEKFFLIINK